MLRAKRAAKENQKLKGANHFLGPSVNARPGSTRVRSSSGDQFLAANEARYGSSLRSSGRNAREARNGRICL
jgi:hypothetical protein